MGKFKGTKGKWVITRVDDIVGDSAGNIRINIGIDVWFSSCHTVKIKKEAIANALLISKAPEMLEMLEYLNARGGLGLEAHAKIKQLITEATEL